MTTADLLSAWRDAVRAADLAERLAVVASEAAARADVRASDAEEIATLAEHVAEAASQAALRARAVATETARVAHELRTGDTAASADSVTSRERQVAAGQAYHDAEARSRDGHGENEAG